MLRLVTDEASRQYLRGPTLRAWNAALGAELDRVRGRPFFLIALPGSLHTVLPCIALAGRRVPVVVIGNGLRAWEAELVRQAGARYLALPTVAGAVAPHGLVLRILLDGVDRPFALHDPDLFVFRPRLYDDLEPRDGEAATGVYGFTNASASLTFPTTHLLAVDAAAVRAVCRKHAVTPEVYRRTPARLREPLASVGIGEHNFPKTHLKFYDVFTLVWTLVLCEGGRIRVLTSPADPDVLHIGGMSYDRDNPRLRYVHARFLALPIAEPVRERYWPALVGKGTTLEQLERGLAGAPWARDLRAVDAGMDRLASVLHEPRA
jgi:hypothetical protein